MRYSQSFFISKEKFDLGNLEQYILKEDLPYIANIEHFPYIYIDIVNDIKLDDALAFYYTDGSVYIQFSDVFINPSRHYIRVVELPEFEIPDDCDLMTSWIL